MNQWYFYLLLNDEFAVLRAQEDTDRVGLMGATFASENQARDYVERLNREVDKLDSS